MVLLVLGVVWAVLLIGWFKTRPTNAFQDSVVMFRRNLSVLESSSPRRISPANRMRVASRPPAGISGQRRNATVYGRPAGVATPVQRSARVGANAHAIRRRAAQRRRRDVLLSLLAGAFGSFLLALVPGMSAIWFVQLIFDLLVAGYVAVLLQVRGVSTERQRKVSYMPPARQPGDRRPRAAFSRGYADLEFQQVAN